MQPKIYNSVLALCLILITFVSINSSAQCTNRYIDTIYSSVDTFANIAYTNTAGGSNISELMDIYQPTADTACRRHLIIWLHGGAFFQGNKNDGDMQLLSKRFAQRGYVCASINYRLASSIVLLYDSTQIFKYAWEAMSDLKSCIRYFYKDAAQGNHWNIDTNSIFIGGSSAGAIASDFAETIDSINELAPSFQTIALANGGLDGNSGNDGYSTKVIGVASLAGAVNSLEWIKASAPPIVMCQGTADGTIPYDCGIALTQYTFGLYPTIHFCGSGQMAPRLDSVGVINSLLPFPGSGHVPWDTNTVIANRMDSAVAAFFYTVKCTQISGKCESPVTHTGLNDIAKLTSVKVYPNPIQGLIKISAENTEQLSTITLYNYMGAEMIRQNISGNNAQISAADLSPGVYLIKLEMRNGDTFTQKIEKE